MKLSQVLFVLLLICFQSNAQDYVDIVKISGNKTSLGNIDTDFESDVTNLNAELYYPTRINEDLILLTGFTVENTSLELFSGADQGSLLMTRLNVGFKYQLSEKWSGTYVLLPKLASDFDNVSGKDFQFGGLALFDYQYTDSWKLKFGAYVSSENFGATITPIVGVWHRSKNEKFYLNATLPIRMDANYAITNGLSLGLDLLTSIKSYNLSELNSDFYVQEESIRFAFYGAYGFMENSLILRGKVGFDTTDYGLYGANDTIGAQVLTFAVSGDDRNRLNSEFEGALFFGADLLYRFDLSKEKKD